jgi:hypothetical protein
LEQALAPLRSAARQSLNEAQLAALVRRYESQVAAAYWNEQLATQFTPAHLQGEAAKTLAQGLAKRWEIEMKAVGDLASALNEREAYRAAPRIYRARRVMEVLVDGIKDARKYFLAFDPGARKVRVRFMATEQPVNIEDLLGTAGQK